MHTVEQMTYLAPAGTPVSLRDIAAGVGSSLSGSTAEVVESLMHTSRLHNVWLISSGRAAMTVILRAMQVAADVSSRDEVIIPAYTCYSVPAAIARAGLRPRICDIDATTLGMSPDVLERCDFSRVLAVVSANLYGLPNDLSAIESVCKRRGVYLLDDAAQGLGASLDGRAVGSFGDAGLYSFDKGKIISTMQGGAIVCEETDLAAKLNAAVLGLPRSSLTETSGNFVKLLIYSIFLRPTLYGVIRRLPFTGLGHSIYETRYPITQLSRIQTGVAARLLARLEELNAGRRRRAHEYSEALHGLPGIKNVRLTPGATAAFARYPFRLRKAESRDRVLKALKRAGIGATASYPQSLADVPEVNAMIPAADRNCPGAREVAKTIVTLPTHDYCPPDLAATVRTVLSECLA